MEAGEVRLGPTGLLHEAQRLVECDRARHVVCCQRDRADALEHLITVQLPLVPLHSDYDPLVGVG